MASELNYTLGLQVNEEYFLSFEQCKLNDTPVFWHGDKGFARIDHERYRVQQTGKPIDGLIPYFKSGK